VEFLISDFNGAEKYYAGAGAPEWSDLEKILRSMPLHLHASDQSGIQGTLIFDPKGTNAYLKSNAKAAGWEKIRVPKQFEAFGKDWDAGKRGTLAEWQFSNYPFLANNLMRSEVVIGSRVQLQGVGRVRALVVVTKAGLFPASQSTLYFEQARAQLEAASKFRVFSIPIRLVGLTIPDGAREVEFTRSDYGGRYHRDARETEKRKAKVEWADRSRLYEMPRVSFKLA